MIKTFIKFCILILAALNVQTGVAQNQRILDYRSAKKILNRFEIFSKETLYCGCEIEARKVKTQICGLRLPKQNVRSFQTEWEHVVPASTLAEDIAFDKNRCGRKSKRNCLEKMNPEYAKRISDLYNLYAEEGTLNEIRGNKPFAEIKIPQLLFGQCKSKSNDTAFEPRPEARGLIARTYFYMDKAYPKALILKTVDHKMMMEWDKNHPVTKWECDRAKKIEALQGNSNEFVKSPCQKMQFW